MHNVLRGFVNNFLADLRITLKNHAQKDEVNSIRGEEELGQDHYLPCKQ